MVAVLQCNTPSLNYLMIRLDMFVSFPEAAVRSQKQAESEDCDQVDIEHFEKILPQLVCSSTEIELGF